ncbi:MAG: PEP-CTERM sorting domain-containing protein [Gammaproteobacteria bacterium]|nr:PEP-CTERM sorting domain-containing protein [Gammaproteobacteria bacterium]
MKRVYRSLVAGAALTLFAMASQAAPLHQFNWTGTLKITGFDITSGSNFLNPDNNLFTTRMEWTIDNGSSSTLGTPSGAPTVVSGALTLSSVPAQISSLPVTIITNIADFLLSSGVPAGPINFPPSFPVASASGASLFTVPIVDAGSGLDTSLNFTYIETGPNSLIYDVTETPSMGSVGSLGFLFNNLDGSVSPPKDGIIQRGFVLNATVEEVPTGDVPAPATLLLVAPGLLGLFLRRSRA